MHEKSADGEANGNGAWQGLIKWYETEQAQEIMTRSILHEIESLSYNDSGSQTMGGLSIRSICTYTNMNSTATKTLQLGPQEN